MQVSEILSAIDDEIARLQEARSVLAGSASANGTRKKSVGRPAGSKNAASGTRKRRLSPEGRKRIAEAMKRRWAERRKQQAAKTAK